jgi:hypothetical protein
MAMIARAVSLSVHAGTSFTYQGRLVQGTNSPTGEFDFRFTLYTDPLVGSAATEPVTNAAVKVDNGVFTTMIDFGPGVFAGEDLWLEIAARTNGSRAFTTLVPRQAMTPTPEALFSVTAANYSGPVSASQITGAIPPSLLPADLLSLTNLSGLYTTNTSTLALLSALGFNTMLQTNYTFTTNKVTGVAGSQPIVSSSTFSAWGQPVGVVTNPFNRLVVAVYPFDTSSVPTHAVAAVRVQGPFENISGTGPSGITNPSAWTLLGQAQQTFAAPVGQFTYVGFTFTNPIASTSNLWMEILTDGHAAFLGLNPSPGQPTNASIYPRTEYQTTKSLSSTAWVVSASALPAYEFWAAFETTLTTNLAVNYAMSGITNAAALFYNNASSGLASQNVQGAIDQIATNSFPAYLSPYVKFSLPATNYAVPGTEMNLYFDNVLRSQVPIPNLWVNVTSSWGAQYGSFGGFYRLEPVSTNAGISPFYMTVGYETNILSSYNGYLKVSTSSAGNGVTRKLLLVGDSTTAGGEAVSGLWTNMNTDVFKLSFVGTQGTSPINHEGRAGYTLNRFYAGDANGPSPFTNSSGIFDFHFYLTNNGFTMLSGDWVVVNLGINDVFNAATDVQCESIIQSFTNQFSLMASNILSVVPGIRVGLCITIPPSQSQDGFGVNYATGQTYYRYRRNRYLLAETLALYSQSGVYLWPINECLDTVNNMNRITGPVNARNTNTWTFIGNGVHPALSGYLQIADCYWAILKGNE